VQVMRSKRWRRWISDMCRIHYRDSVSLSSSKRL